MTKQTHYVKTHTVQSLRSAQTVSLQHQQRVHIYNWRGIYVLEKNNDKKNLIWA